MDARTGLMILAILAVFAVPGLAVQETGFEAEDSPAQMSSSGTASTAMGLSSQDASALAKCRELFANERFGRGVIEIASHSRIRFLLAMEAFLIVFTVLMRTWRTAYVTHWAGRLVVNLTTTTLFWVMAAGVIPIIVLGSAYWDVVMGLFELAD